MREIQNTLFFAAIFAIAVISGCSKPTTSLTSGMKMVDAVSEMKQRGLRPQKMAYATSHNAFDLTDGRTVVLIGDATVDEIQIIANPSEPKSTRKTETVTTLKF